MFKGFIIDKRSSSRFSRRSSKWNSSGSSKSDTIKGKGKLAELLVQEAFFEKHQQVKNEAQRLRMQENLRQGQELKFLNMWS